MEAAFLFKAWREGRKEGGREGRKEGRKGRTSISCKADWRERERPNRLSNASTAGVATFLSLGREGGREGGRVRKRDLRGGREKGGGEGEGERQTEREREGVVGTEKEGGKKGTNLALSMISDQADRAWGENASRRPEARRPMRRIAPPAT